MDAALQALSWCQSLLQFESAILCGVSSAIDNPSFNSIINHSYPKDWLHSYIRENFVTIDPVIQHAMNGNQYFQWDDAFNHANNSKNAHSFRLASHDYGMTGGIVIGNPEAHRFAKQRKFALCSIANFDPNNYALTNYLLMTLFPCFQLILEGTKGNGNHLPLSGKELNVLDWSRLGKTVWETSVILGISESTVKFHLKNIYRKLGVCNRAQAIAVADAPLYHS